MDLFVDEDEDDGVAGLMKILGLGLSSRPSGVDSIDSRDPLLPAEPCSSMTCKIDRTDVSNPITVYTRLLRATFVLFALILSAQCLRQEKFLFARSEAV